MEKTIIAALLMLISLISYAQGLMWTAKAELNMSSMSNVEESKMHPGFYAGMGAGYVIDETWSVRPSLLCRNIFKGYADIFCRCTFFRY